MLRQEELVRLIVNPTLEVGVGFRLRTREQGARQTIIMLKEQPELCRLLIELAGESSPAERLGEIPAPVLDQLVTSGVLIHADETPDDLHYECLLDELPLELLPANARQPSSRAAQGEEFCINPNLYLQTQAEVPPPLEGRTAHHERLQQGNALLWVEDIGTKVLAPYGLKQQWIEPLRRLVAGQLPPATLAPPILDVLKRAQVLIPRDDLERRCRQWEETCGELSAQLRTKQYAVVRGILHPLQLSVFRRYFRLLDEKGHLRLQAERNRYVMHNEGLSRFIHHQTSSLINRLTPEPVKPSYSYLCTYKDGGFIPRHTDRAQCAWNLSLLIDTEPEASLAEAWPIYLDIEGKVEEVRLEMGDGVLYRGTDIPHWRDPLEAGKKATLIFCHYVPADFEGSLN